MKVLILVMSSRVQDYPLLEKVQRETWDSIAHPDTVTVYYKAGNVTQLVQDNLYIKGGEEWQNFFSRTILAFKEVLKLEWDYLFKTDNSAYIHKPKLVEELQDKPDKKFFGGKLYVQTSPMNTTNFFWGEGYCLSRDVVEGLVAQAPELIKIKAMDDMQMSKTLYGKVEFTNLPMCEYYRDPKPFPIVHVYRCKRGFGKHHSDEIAALRDLHRLLNNESKE